MFKLRIKDSDLKEMNKRLQSSGVEVASSLSTHGATARWRIENRLNARFPDRGPALSIEMSVQGDGLSIWLTGADGLLDSVSEEASAIINEELAAMGRDIHSDLARGIKGAGF